MTAYNFKALQDQSPWVPGMTFTVGGYFKLTGALVNADTITFTNAIPSSGVTAISAVVYTTQLDSNATPTGTFSLGDSLADGSAAARYISGAKMGTNVAGQQIVTFSNVAPTFTGTDQTAGVGYLYTTDENSNAAQGFLDLKLTVTNAVATAAATGTVWVYFTYYCGGVA